MTTEPLVKNLRYGRKMEPFVDRLRVRLRDYEPVSSKAFRALTKSRTEMQRILRKNKVPSPKARKAIDEAIVIALDYQLETLRRRQYLQARHTQQTNLEGLTSAIDKFKQALSKLDLAFRRELNKVTAKQDWDHFDTEVLAEFIQAIIEKTSKLSPDLLQTGTRLAQQTLRGSIGKDVRTLGPKIIALWETISPITRTAVEASVRRRFPTTSTAQALNHLRNELSRLDPGSKKPPGTTRLFSYRMAKLWRGLGLRTGRVYYNGNKNIAASHQEGDFQRFARVAMAAVEGSTKISSRFILRLNAEQRQGKHPPRLRH